MTQPQVAITLDGGRRVFRPGEMLAGEYRILHVSPAEIEALEVSVAWYTEGKGGEDLGVHLFRRILPSRRTPINPNHPGRFSTILPASPLSYTGVIVKIRWCVRVRLYLNDGRETIDEHPFQLGEVPHAEVAAS